jgi:phenylpropionate dioxygenase-like ring-hydroxylating dioxygenase large terminal subunit
MLTQEQNDALTRTGPGTPGGELLRRYWQPVALADELPEGGDPIPVDILGEELVLFRDEQNRIGLLDRHCCHRGTDLSYGRVENGGLRCLYHGWLYDVNGRCLEQPLEPKELNFKDKVRQPSYPVVERAGAFFAYMGPLPAPEFPDFDFFTFPASHLHSHKVFLDCNYMQANEGNYDPAHVGQLHRAFDPDRKPGLNFGSLKTIGVSTEGAVIEPYETPKLKVENTRFGLRIFQIRSGGPGRTYLRVTAYGMPNWSVIAGPQGGDGHIGIWHVPIDDYSHWRWHFSVRRDAPLDHTSRMAQNRSGDEYADRFHHARTAKNRYKQDRSKFSESFTGMGRNFNVHDAFATESQGAIQDRTREHLATSDLAVAAARRMMLRGIEDIKAGKDPVGVVRDKAANDFHDLRSIDALFATDADLNEVVRQVVEPPAQAAE